MDRRQFLVGLPAIGMVGEEKKTGETITIEGFEVVDFSDGGIMPCTRMGNGRLAWLNAQLECARIWGKKSVGQAMTVTVHKDGYDVRFAKG